MEISLSGDVQIAEISVSEYNVAQTNRIKKEYGGLRQESKAPT